MSCGCHLGLQRWVCITAASTAVNGCRSLPPPSQELAWPATAKGPNVWGQLPQQCTWPATAAEGPVTWSQPLPLPPWGCTTHRPCCPGTCNLGPTSPGYTTHYHCSGTCNQDPTAAPTFLGAGVSCAPGQLHTPYEGDNSQYTLWKETESMQTKNSPHAPKILSSHKLHRMLLLINSPPKLQ